MSKASFKRALATATHVHVENLSYPELSGVREIVKVQTNALSLRLPVGHPRYDEVVNGSWTYFDTADTAEGDTYVQNDPMTGEVFARFTVVPAPVLDMFTVVGSGSYDADTDTVWMATHSSVVDGSDARLLAPGWNAEGWGTMENENGDRWRDQSLYWDEYVID